MPCFWHPRGCLCSHLLRGGSTYATICCHVPSSSRASSAHSFPLLEPPVLWVSTCPTENVAAHCATQRSGACRSPPVSPQPFLLPTSSRGTGKSVELLEAQVLPLIRSQMHPEAGLSLLQADFLHKEGSGPCSETHLGKFIAFFSLSLFLF